MLFVLLFHLENKFGKQTIRMRIASLGRYLLNLTNVKYLEIACAMNRLL